MSVGQSGGRSRGNNPRASARRRFSDRERELSTPLPDDPQAWPEPITDDSSRVEIILLRIATVVLLIICSLLILF